MFELLQRWLARYARSSWAPRRIGTVAAVLALLVVAAVITAASAGGGSNSRFGTAAHVHIDTSGSPATFVRGVLLASYSGDAADACAQLTPQALAQLGGAQQCESAVSTSPSDAARVRSAHYWPTVAGDRAVVLTSASNILFQDSSQVELVKTGGRWKISCIGYCRGPATHVHIDATGSPATFVRDVLLASYSGDAADACAQLTPRALAQLGGAQQCEWAVWTSPFNAARVRSAHYWPTVAGDRAVVLTSASNILFQDSSQVDLVKTGGRWKISCIGYCSGPNP